MYPSTDIRQIKAALRDQAFLGRTLVWCPMGRVVAVRKRKGQLLAMIRGWGVRWYTVESVSIETQFVLPASSVFLGRKEQIRTNEAYRPSRIFEAKPTSVPDNREKERDS